MSKEYLSFYWPNFDQTVNVGYWKHLWQMSTVMVTFVKATYVWATIVHIQFWPKFLGPIFFGTFFGPKFSLTFFFTQIFFWPTILWAQIFLDPKSIGLKISLNQNFNRPTFFGPNFFQTQNILDPTFFWSQILFDPKYFWSRNFLVHNFF